MVVVVVDDALRPRLLRQGVIVGGGNGTLTARASEIVVGYLEREGYRTLEAADGNRARELLENDAPDPSSST